MLMAACSSNIQDEASILQCVEVLLEAGASVNDFDRYTLFMTQVITTASCKVADNSLSQ